jgi:hypothetical protein
MGAFTSETSVPTYQTTQRYSPEEMFTTVRTSDLKTGLSSGKLFIPSFPSLAVQFVCARLYSATLSTHACPVAAAKQKQNTLNR